MSLSIVEIVKTWHLSQILEYFGFYVVDNDESFVLYKNIKCHFYCVFNNESEEINIIDLQQFKIIDKLSLFLLVSDIDFDTIIDQASLIFDLDITKFRFTESNTAKKIINGFVNIQSNNQTKDIFDTDIFLKGEKEVYLLKEKDKLIDFISLDDSEYVYSEFGNNKGYIKKHNNNTSVQVTYNPSFINQKSRGDDIYITKYKPEVDLVFELLNKYDSIQIIQKDSFSLCYKLSLLCQIYNILQNDTFKLTLQPNSIHIQLHIIYNYNSIDDKLIYSEIINRVISKVHFLASKYFEDMNDKESLKSVYKINYDSGKFKNKGFYKIDIRNKKMLLQIFIDELVDLINSKGMRIA